MDKTSHKDYIIIGAGPAGLQLGYFFQKNNLDFLILEKDKISGSFFRDNPRHRSLISINKVFTGFDDKDFNLRFDWNSLLCDKDELQFKEYSTKYFPKADTLVNYLNDFANAYELPINYNVEVTKIGKDEKFVLSASNGETYVCNYLIVATGWVAPYIPNISGIEHGVHYMDMKLDKEIYQNKRVLIVGKGNSAFEIAEDLVDTTAITHICSSQTIKMAWNTHYVGDVRAVNNNFLDTYHLKSQNAILDADINSIKEEDNQFRVKVTYNNLAGEEEELIYDHILLCTGFKFDNSIFEDECKPEVVIKGRFPNQTPEYESVNVKDLYFAGTLTHMRDYKKQASGFIHGFRYNASFLARNLANKNHQIKLPSVELAWDTDTLCDKIIDRINSNSSLWNQYGYFGDLAVINYDKVTYYESLPVDFINEKMMGEDSEYFIITMEFGEKKEVSDHLSNTRIHRDDYENAKDSVFIHPIVRHYANNKMVNEFHIIEDLEAIWREPIHIKPLKKFIKSVNDLNKISE
ncbi:NAD(P)-binding domain-containing protein [Kordia algicida OT-1]|uniref:Potassium transporter (Trk family) protein n=1 Tax=Kordia algicida OT-1 TaxID=391587 RepID=A9EDC2_9FLAO|nr:NAD(P)-binding domain-containing protein [Kordia algicida]EDP94255.1 potassium transporter (Trk family) protein [Kordia algicida OT-1]